MVTEIGFRGRSGRLTVDSGEFDIGHILTDVRDIGRHRPAARTDHVSVYSSAQLPAFRLKH